MSKYKPWVLGRYLILKMAMVGLMVHIWFVVLICNKTINNEYHECACSIIMFTLHYKLLQRHTIVIHMYIPLHTITKTTIHNQITSCKQGGLLRILGHPLISRIVFLQIPKKFMFAKNEFLVQFFTLYVF